MPTFRVSLFYLFVLSDGKVYEIIFYEYFILNDKYLLKKRIELTVICYICRVLSK